jgi:hypothetical protein
MEALHHRVGDRRQILHPVERGAAADDLELALGFGGDLAGGEQPFDGVGEVDA